MLVATARRFVAALYTALAQGESVGQAVLAAQQVLRQMCFRDQVRGAGALQMQDWFVPILYQESHDPQLFECIPSDRAKKMQAQQQKARLGQLPSTPTHCFIGRSRELLTLERLLLEKPYATLRGLGGIGKTTLAVALCRWLVRSQRFSRCAFVSL